MKDDAEQKRLNARIILIELERDNPRNKLVEA